MYVNTRISINAKKHNKHYYYYLCLVEITPFSIINKPRHLYTTPEQIQSSAQPTVVSRQYVYEVKFNNRRPQS